MTLYKNDVAEKICEQLAEGKSLASICRSDDFPSKAVVFNWIRKFPEFREMYDRAKMESTDALFEEILDIADNASNDWMERNDPKNPGWVVNGDHIQRDRIRVDVRKWALSKLKPKKFGDSINAKLSGDAENPIEVKDISKEEFTKKLLFALTKLSKE